MDNDRALDAIDDTDLIHIAGTVGSDEHGETLIELFRSYRLLKAWIIVSSATPCLRALGAIRGVTTATSYLAVDRLQDNL